MPEVSLTKFLDFVCTSGTPRHTIVRDWKQKEDYDPRIDFYKPLREAIAEGHKIGDVDAVLHELLPTLTDKKKIDIYPELITGYNKWIRRRIIQWFQPVRTSWQCGELIVAVNPEFGLLIDGIPYQIKLYFKEPKLNRYRINVITHLLTVSRPPKLLSDCRLAVLDVRRGKLFEAGAPDPVLDVTLKSDVAAWMAIWSAI